MRTTSYSLQQRHGGSTDAGGGDQATWVEIAGSQGQAGRGVQLAAMLELGTRIAANTYSPADPGARTIRLVETTTASAIDGGDGEGEVVWFAGSRIHANQDIA